MWSKKYIYILFISSHCPFLKDLEKACYLSFDWQRHIRIKRYKERYLKAKHLVLPPLGQFLCRLKDFIADFQCLPWCLSLWIVCVNVCSGRRGVPNGNRVRREQVFDLDSVEAGASWDGSVQSGAAYLHPGAQIFSGQALRLLLPCRLPLRVSKYLFHQSVCQAWS